MQLSTTNYSILDSGTVIIPSCENYVEFIISELKFRFYVKNNLTGDDGLAKQGFFWKKNEATDYMEMTLINPGHANHVTNIQFANVAHIQNKQLLFRFCITEINVRESDVDWLLHYTWYLEK